VLGEALGEQEVLDPLEREMLALFQHQHGARAFPQTFIGHAHDGDVCYRRVPVEQVFYPVDGYILPAADNDVLAAADQRHVAVLVHRRLVAAPEPAVDDRLRGKVRAGEISGEEPGAPYLQVTHLARPGWLSRALHHPDLATSYGDPVGLLYPLPRKHGRPGDTDPPLGHAPRRADKAAQSSPGLRDE